MDTHLKWMFHGVGRGESALVVNSGRTAAAVAEILKRLHESLSLMPRGAQLTIWCGTEYFEFLGFEAFESAKDCQGFSRITFSARCNKDGLVKFVWERNPNQHNDYGDHRLVDSLSFFRK